MQDMRSPLKKKKLFIYLFYNPFLIRIMLTFLTRIIFTFLVGLDLLGLYLNFLY